MHKFKLIQITVFIIATVLNKLTLFIKFLWRRILNGNIYTISHIHRFVLG